jgi:integrase
LWEKIRKNDARFFSAGHEYIIVYAKSESTLRENNVYWREDKPGPHEIFAEYQRLRDTYGDDFPAMEKELKSFYSKLSKEHPAKKHARYNKVDENGVWRDDNLSWPGGGGPEYDVIHPATGMPCKVPTGGWRFPTPQRMQEMIDNGVVVFRDDHTEPPIRKSYLVRKAGRLSDEESIGKQVMGTYFYRSAIQATSMLEELIGKRLFDHPKDLEILQRLISYITDKDSIMTKEKIHKLLSCAFRQAVRWEIIAKNPFESAMIPRTGYNKRDIWTADMIKTALNTCRDSKLYIAMNLAFACSLRVGEILGLTWDNVHISDEAIAADDAYVFINKELERISKSAMDILGEKDILFTFPAVLSSNASTRLVLMTPKTESSVRKVWLPKTVAYILREWKKSQDELKDFLGDEYQDYNLVITLQNGRPCENRVLQKEFTALKKEAELPHVVFHSLRHSSTTYKLKLNHGDLKATQGDTGHAQIDMITDVYSHILDEDRKVNAQKFEAAFYSNPDLRDVRPPAEGSPGLDLQALLVELKNNPELAATLAQILSVQDSDDK